PAACWVVMVGSFGDGVGLAAGVSAKPAAARVKAKARVRLSGILDGLVMFTVSPSRWYLGHRPRRLKKRDMLRPKLDKPRGLLHHSVEPGVPGYGRYWPADDLAPFIEHFWTVAWDVAEPEVHEVLPHPSVHLVLERGFSRVSGVPTGKFTRRLEGKGHVLGTKFRPGGFRPFFGRAVSEMTDRLLTLAEAFGEDGDELETRALACADPRNGFELVQEFLRGLDPAPDPTIDLVDRIAERAAT